MDSIPKIYAPSQNTDRLWQGEIVTNLIQVRINLEDVLVTEPSQQAHLRNQVHPWAIIVTQDCDLEWDFQARKGDAKIHKLIPNILLCEMREAGGVRQDNVMVPGSKDWNQIQQNKNERFQFLQKATKDDDAQQEGLSELVVDFKRYFTVPTDELYARLEAGQIKRRCRLQSPYLEHFCTRFHYFQYRVALPSDHFSE